MASFLEEVETDVANLQLLSDKLNQAQEEFDLAQRNLKKAKKAYNQKSDEVNQNYKDYIGRVFYIKQNEETTYFKIIDSNIINNAYMLTACEIEVSENSFFFKWNGSVSLNYIRDHTAEITKEEFESIVNYHMRNAKDNLIEL